MIKAEHKRSGSTWKLRKKIKKLRLGELRGLNEKVGSFLEFHVEGVFW